MLCIFLYQFSNFIYSKTRVWFLFPHNTKGMIMKTILITGGAGFIGINTARYFLEKEWRVVVVDNLSRNGSAVNLDWLLSQYPTNQRPFTYVVLDIIDSDGYCLNELMQDISPDVILHAAAQVAVTNSVADPRYDFKVNALGTINMLEAARMSSVNPVFIFTSTNKVYGSMETVGIYENNRRYDFGDEKLTMGVPEEYPLDFHSPYGCSKGAADQYVRDYYRIYGLPTVVFRQSCIYGERQFGIVDQGWVAYLTARAMLDMPITIYGNGKQVRDILFMDDLCGAFFSAIACIEKSTGQIYNIGGGPKNTVSVIDFIHLLGKKLGKTIKYSFSDWRPGDQKIYISDIRKAQRDFDWHPEVNMEVGIDKMINWTKQNLKLLQKNM